ncbi:MAG: transcription antitermination factor NusB [Myxococcales bacterium]|nr:MAG: transcription antitermination factor NusB [Myxococcales bacterium]
MPRSKRRLSRATALQILCFVDLAKLDIETGINRYWACFESYGSDPEFANEMSRGVSASIEKLDAFLQGASEHWRLERMPLVDRNLLRLAVYELWEKKDVPVRVVLNEAVELAKLFGAENSPSFVNGVLDKIARELERS